ncbi:prepilin peptidase [Ancylobacter sp. WKF20]|uniref:preprotein translocase subunit SecA n=1 Tax=Ancylobacter sp. WKF20 TaxID=3039801 RepID=UPI0024341C5C|nr:prepilin peptidase [Ancylobacter sp. WKF20]WGD30999.1 prepilin peptidase [Ancylobacter sp. WKF20]
MGPLPSPVLYAERSSEPPRRADRLLKRLEGLVIPHFAGRRQAQLARIVPLVHAAAAELEGVGEDEVASRARAMAGRLRRSRSPAMEDIAATFALVREVSGRTLGMKHHDVQLMGGFALMSGMVAEMNTGEGKTLTATLAAVTAALAGKPVHVVTVNDYLARRDAEKLAPIFGFFGLSVGVVAAGMEREARRAAYACDVTYCTNKELAFDHLKDRLVLAGAGGNLRRKMRFAGMGTGGDAPGRDLLLRGLHVAIVDEADSVLIDEARTPLILSGEVESAAEAELLRQALAVAQALRAGHDYVLVAHQSRIDLTEVGRKRLDGEAAARGGLWLNQVLREDVVVKALTALHVMLRGEQYIVRDGKVEIVDEYTGRIMAERFWSDGLHQLVELKEGVSLSPRRRTLARMTYQRLFRRYEHLCGMSGTVAEVAGELWEVYGLRIARIPTHKPPRRKLVTDVILPRSQERWRTVAQIAARFQRQQVPLLIGTRSVAASLEASHHLSEAGVVHQVLNATDEAAEVSIVEKAGHAGQVTVATNMAGRGTDIPLGPGVAQRGGLLVLMTERHDSARVDRQLAGRTARQGDPGVFVAVLSLEDKLLADCPLLSVRLAARLAARWGSARLARLAMRLAQRHAERDHARIRRQLLQADEALESVLAITGTLE